MRLLITATAALIAASAAHAADVQVLTSKDPKLAWKTVALPNGKTADYTHGVGSGAFRHPSDPANVIWTVGDRGPNFTCQEGVELVGKDLADLCRKQKNGRIYPTPEYAPSIYKLELDPAAKSFKVLDIIEIKTKSGKPISGLANPQTRATKDTAVDLAGKVLADHPDNLDVEGIIRMADGTFWVGDEMGPSIAHLSADGRILKRIVPTDQVDDYKSSEGEVIGALPSILSKRQGNRGIESMTMSPDEKFLYFIVQNPLANPDVKAYQQAKNTRLFKFDPATNKVVAQFVYQLDDPQTFALDPSDRQNDPRISELTALGSERFLVLERTDGTTKLHEITLAGATDIVGSKWDDEKSLPSLEQQNDLTKLEIVPVKKTLRFDTARDFKTAPGKIESVAFLGDGTMVLINDNDFAIKGDETQILLVKGAVTADKQVYAK